MWFLPAQIYNCRAEASQLKTKAWWPPDVSHGQPQNASTVLYVRGDSTDSHVRLQIVEHWTETDVTDVWMLQLIQGFVEKLNHVVTHSRGVITRNVSCSLTANWLNKSATQFMTKGCWSVTFVDEPLCTLLFSAAAASIPSDGFALLPSHIISLSPALWKHLKRVCILTSSQLKISFHLFSCVLEVQCSIVMTACFDEYGLHWSRSNSFWQLCGLTPLLLDQIEFVKVVKSYQTQRVGLVASETQKVWVYLRCKAILQFETSKCQDVWGSGLIWGSQTHLSLRRIEPEANSTVCT